MISGLPLFPGGATGAGLLLLRFSVAISLLMLSAMHSGAANWLQFLAILTVASLCAGFQTRVLGGLSLAAPIFALAASRTPLLLAALHIVDALALVLTGPGAWSADAVLFGRRIVTLPDRNNTIV
jgi:hypothetical protein